MDGVARERVGGGRCRQMTPDTDIVLHLQTKLNWTFKKRRRQMAPDADILVCIAPSEVRYRHTYLINFRATRIGRQMTQIDGANCRRRFCPVRIGQQTSGINDPTYPNHFWRSHRRSKNAIITDRFNTRLKTLLE